MEEVNKEAVDNFIASMDSNLSVIEHILNIGRDAKLYGWNKATVDAIKHLMSKRYREIYKSV